jgi:thiol:disulfide interchange protein DsbC
MQCNNSFISQRHYFLNSVLLFAALSLPVLAFAGTADDKAFDSLHFNWKALRLADAIKEVRGNGTRVIAVFTEPECGYCRKYEKTLTQVDNVTIYRFLIPLDANRSRASVTVWCAGDTDEERLEALTAAMQNRGRIAGPDRCANPIAANVRFAKQQDIYLTPTTIGADGRIVQGYLPLVNLEKWLSGKGAFAP